jgi:carboxyl-terminal processing protease
VRKAINVSVASGVVETKKRAEVYEGPADDTDLIGWAKKDARFKVVGTVGSWTKVELESKRPGFILTSKVARTDKSAGGAGGVEPAWQVTPPSIAIKSPTYATGAAAYSLQGTVSDETHVEDVYVFVSNPGAKIDGRKIFYKSNRGGSTANKLDFTADVPLWPGSNQITVIARENADVRALSTMYVYREEEKTAAK